MIKKLNWGILGIKLSPAKTILIAMSLLGIARETKNDARNV